jgi:hypothetical protein
MRSSTAWAIIFYVLGKFHRCLQLLDIEEAKAITIAALFCVFNSLPVVCYLASAVARRAWYFFEFFQPDLVFFTDVCMECYHLIFSSDELTHKTFSTASKQASAVAIHRVIRGLFVFRRLNASATASFSTTKPSKRAIIIAISQIVARRCSSVTLVRFGGIMLFLVT